jgi:hypothetical protein
MIATKRQHGLGIWALTLGYFAFYVPYSGLTKAVTSGLLTGGLRVSGLELLPSTVISTAIAIPLFITTMKWWRYGRRRSLFGSRVLFPRRQTFISGLGFATIIVTTTLAYSFRGVSIVLALVLMRAGVLVMSPLIDRVFRRRVRWFSWAGLVLSLMSLFILFKSTNDYQLSLAALLNLAGYLTGYATRLPCMTAIAKTGDTALARDYFVEEQAVAMPALALVPAAFAFLGRGEIAEQLHFGFTHLFSSSFVLPGLAIGLFYAGLGVFLSFIYLDRRENSFCMPLFACSSLLSGIVASYILVWWLHAPSPSGAQISAASLIIAALLVMSPLHHLSLYIRQLKSAIVEGRLVVVRFGQMTSGLETAPETGGASFITVNFEAIRDVLKKQSHAGVVP